MAAKTSPAIAYPQLAVLGLRLSSAKKRGQTSVCLPSLAIECPFPKSPAAIVQKS